MNKNVSKNSNRVLYGKVLPTLFIIALPLFLNYLLELVYNVFDTFALSSTGIGDAGSVVLLSQIKSLLSSTGTALISGAAILMTSYLGRQDKQKARMVITQILYILVGFSIFCLIIFIGFGKPFLRLLQTPQDIINSSYGYYVVLIISLIIGLFNNLYSNVMMAKGDTKKVLIHNGVVILIKVSLSSFIVYSGVFKNITSTYLAIATIIAELTLFIPAITHLTSRKSDLSLIKEKPHKKMLLKIFKLSLPIILGGIIFNLTKVVINSMIVNAYGSFVLTFYGLEGLFFGVLTKYIASIQHASSTITGQAMGNGNIKRVITTYKYSLLIATIGGVFNLLFFYLFKEPISMVSLNNDVELSKMLIDFMYVYAINSFCSPILEIVIAYLNSLRITKPKLISDALRTVILRLPL